MGLFSSSHWREIAKEKDAERSAGVKEGLQAAGPPTADDEVYLGASAVHIVRQIEAGHWTAGQVVRAYVRRAALAQTRLNCFVAVRFKDAVEEADALDAAFAVSKTLRGRFHGVPLSIKDQYGLAGYDSSLGYSAWTNDPVHDDASLVTIMREEGAIVLGKTNICQTLLFFECVNPVFGRTSNPWSLKHTPGGSTGGEAALLGADGSALGLGADTGGSLRIPSFYCGLYTLKATHGRVTTAGIRGTSAGFESIPMIAGAMARSLEDVEAFCRVTFGRSAQAWEGLPALPFQKFDLPTSKPLRFGYYTFDGCIRSSPAVQRAMSETVAALRKAGHEVVEFVPPDINAAVELFAGLTAADGYSTMLNPIGGDPKMPELFLITLGPMLPGFVRSLAGWLVATIVGDKKFQSNLAASKRTDVAGYFKLTAQRDDYIQRWYSEVWEKAGFDGLIVPPHAVPAPAHGDTKMVPQLAVATFLWNLLDFPTGVVPVTRVDPAKDALTPEWLNGGPRGGIMVERPLYYASSPIYDVKAMNGLPVGVQIVGPRNEDEKVLAMMRVVDEALGKRSFGPGSWTP